MLHVGRQATQATFSSETIPAPARRTNARSSLTLFDLVEAVADSADSEAEVIATVQHLLASGRVRLVGRDARKAPRRKSSRA